MSTASQAKSEIYLHGSADGGTIPFMPKKSAKPANIRVHEDALPEYIRSRMGDLQVKQYAAKIGVTREALSSILNGHREPGPKLIRALGIKGVEKTYIIEG